MIEIPFWLYVTGLICIGWVIADIIKFIKLIRDKINRNDLQ